MWRPNHNETWSINIKYNFKKSKITACYRTDISSNKDSELFKQKMKSKGYVQGYSIYVDDLELNNSKPNENVIELFNYFSNMINYAKILYQEELSQMNRKNQIIEIENKLINNFNIILRGAPGTGKTYLAKEIAANILSDGEVFSTEKLNEEQIDRLGFVQFHPSYDYTDFVEGLRPVFKEGSFGFEYKEGIFKKICNNAKMSFNDNVFNVIWDEFIDNVEEEGEIIIPSKKYKKERRFILSGNRTLKKIDNIGNGQTFTKYNIFNTWVGESGRKNGGDQATMDSILIYLEDKYKLPKYNENENDRDFKKYVFIIDEINRGEISKIFGELFYSIDPDYRGEAGSIITQYSNMNEDNEKFYIPDNVYIIGTMNDIDKSVDTFDFAMRRRFSFIEITAEDSQKMLANEEVKEQMTRLNGAIVSSEINLTNDYQIGASYFLKLDQGKVNVNELWDNKLYPLLKDYFRGERLVQDKLEILKNAYYGNSDEQEDNEG